MEADFDPVFSQFLQLHLNSYAINELIINEDDNKNEVLNSGQICHNFYSPLNPLTPGSET